MSADTVRILNDAIGAAEREHDLPREAVRYALRLIADGQVDENGRAVPRLEPAADSGADTDFKALNEIAAMFGYSLVSETTTFRPDAASVVKPSELPELLRRFAPASSAALGPQMERIERLLNEYRDWVTAEPAGRIGAQNRAHANEARADLLSAIRSLASAPRASEDRLTALGGAMLERIWDSHPLLLGQYELNMTEDGALGVWAVGSGETSRAIAMFYGDYEEAFAWLAEHPTPDFPEIDAASWSVSQPAPSRGASPEQREAK